MRITRRHIFRLGTAFCFAGFTALLPTTAIEATAPPPPLPDSIDQALRLLASLGFTRSVDAYMELRPTIEVQPPGVLDWAGLTEGWSDTPNRSTTIYLRADLQASTPMLASILAHELLHVEQFVHRPDVYANCAQREIPAYQLEADVLRAWSDANPTDHFELPASCLHLMTVAKYGIPETIEQFATRSSCSLRAAAVD